MHIVHVTAARGLAAIRDYRQRGQPVTGEVCTQHLLLTDALYDQPGFEPALRDAGGSGQGRQV